MSPRFINTIINALKAARIRSFPTEAKTEIEHLFLPYGFAKGREFQRGNGGSKGKKRAC